MGVGESPAAVAALAWAYDVCRRRGWILDVVTGWPDLGEVWVHEVPGHYCDPRGRAVAALQEALAASGVRSHEANVHVYVDNTDPVRALVAHSGGAEMLVVGASGSGRSWRAGCPSVGEACREQALCPVVIVDAESAAPRWTA